MFLFNKRKKKQKPKLKERLIMMQTEEELSIKGKLLHSKYRVVSLLLKARLSEEEWAFTNDETNDGSFSFEVGLAKLVKDLSNSIDENFDWFLKVMVSTEDLTENQVQKLELKAEFVEEDGKLYAVYPIRLGRFAYTENHGFQYVYHNQNSGVCYLTDKGNLSFLLNKPPLVKVKSQIDRMKTGENSFNIEGKIFTKGSKIITSKIVLKSRNTSDEIELGINLSFNKDQTSEKYGLNRYYYSSKINLNTVNKGSILEEDIYDFYLVLQLSDQLEEKYIRIGRPTFRARHFVKESYGINGQEVAIVTPYYTFKGSNLSLEVFSFDLDTFKFLQKKLKFAWIHRLLNRQKDIWLVGERPYKAQDTGYHFFKYMRENHPEKNVYYVIESDSPERKNIEQLGNIIDFKSKDHIIKALTARRIIGSHHPDYLFPIRSKRFKNAAKGIKVFLQHGVMGTKNMIANYGKSSQGFETDMFIVSSEFEKEMIVNDFGYNPKDVFVTGLSRFDSLLSDDVSKKEQILIIPTWRDWITNDESFIESEYFARYKELVNHPHLHKLAEQGNVELIFCLHPNMQKFTNYFSDSPVKVISQGEVDVQHLLKESALMVTDYSSVGFDFSFLHKPIVYYQFDRERFIGKRPSHLDLDNDLPGDIFSDVDDVLSRIEFYIENGFKSSEENIKKANKFMTFRDRQSSQRIYQAISAYPGKSFYMQLIENDLVMGLGNRFRKSRYYFPTMKLFYKMARVIIPKDKKLIVFESGVGKQFADSPRNIYEEIVERQLDYKKVWIINNNIRFKDNTTRKVKRLSPRYYYYLARAGYWVNNQNFPTYIEKSKRTTYIQTWHGTPLKKMLFDIENIQGRDETYLERVHHATKNWDYLVSPSRYATDAFRSAFRYKGEVLEVGYPRNDIFYKPEQFEIIPEVKKKLNLPEGKRVILYAPTFRDNDTKGKNKFQFNLKMDLQRMKEELGDEFILLVRMHVVISNRLVIDDELSDFVYNVSNYSDISDLYLISDVLMTDYSSVMFDFANTGKPLLFFTYDLEEYKNDIRGFYMDFENEAPGPFVFNTDDIIQVLHKLPAIEENYAQKYQLFKEKFCGLEDGNAANRIVNKFFVK